MIYHSRPTIRGQQHGRSVNLMNQKVKPRLKVKQVKIKFKKQLDHD